MPAQATASPPAWRVQQGSAGQRIARGPPEPAPKPRPLTAETVIVLHSHQVAAPGWILESAGLSRTSRPPGRRRRRWGFGGRARPVDAHLGADGITLALSGAAVETRRLTADCGRVDHRFRLCTFITSPPLCHRSPASRASGCRPIAGPFRRPLACSRSTVPGDRGRQHGA